MVTKPSLGAADGSLSHCACSPRAICDTQGAAHIGRARRDPSSVAQAPRVINCFPGSCRSSLLPPWRLLRSVLLTSGGAGSRRALGSCPRSAAARRCDLGQAAFLLELQTSHLQMAWTSERLFLTSRDPVSMFCDSPSHTWSLCVLACPRLIQAGSFSPVSQMRGPRSGEGTCSRLQSLV